MREEALKRLRSAGRKTQTTTRNVGVGRRRHRRRRTDPWGIGWPGLLWNLVLMRPLPPEGRNHVVASRPGRSRERTTSGRGKVSVMSREIAGGTLPMWHTESTMIAWDTWRSRLGALSSRARRVVPAFPTPSPYPPGTMLENDQPTLTLAGCHNPGSSLRPRDSPVSTPLGNDCGIHASAVLFPPTGRATYNRPFPPGPDPHTSGEGRRGEGERNVRDFCRRQPPVPRS